MIDVAYVVLYVSSYRVPFAYNRAASIVKCTSFVVEAL